MKELSLTRLQALGLAALRARFHPLDLAALDDDELVVRARNGSEPAYSELVRRHQRGIFYLARHLVTDEAAAEDLAQETFLRAFRALHRYEANGRFGPWLRTIATRLCLNHVRDRRFEFTDEQELAEREALEASPEAGYLRRVQHERVREAVRLLPGEYRAVVVLRYFEDLSYLEIAARLGLSLPTVETRLHRAKKQLRALLEQMAE